MLNTVGQPPSKYLQSMKEQMNSTDQRRLTRYRHSLEQRRARGSRFINTQVWHWYHVRHALCVAQRRTFCQGRTPSPNSPEERDHRVQRTL